MSYYLTPRAINKINETLGLKLKFEDRNFNILIYIYEHADEYKACDDYEFIEIVKFLTEYDFKMLWDARIYIIEKQKEDDYRIGDSVLCEVIPEIADIVEKNNKMDDRYLRLLIKRLKDIQTPNYKFILKRYEKIYNKYFKIRDMDELKK